MYKKHMRSPRKLSQNFLKSRKLVQKLVGFSSIDKNDLVYEIGPGKGIITEELASKASRVVAVEIDPFLVQYLKQKFGDNGQVQVINQDFLSFEIYSNNYKVFSNLPFSIEGLAIRKLLDSKSPPKDAYLIMQKEVAERLSGYQREVEFSTLHKPWFEFEILHHFSKFDFQPVARVDSVFLRISKRNGFLLPPIYRKAYELFVKSGFRGGSRLAENLSGVLGKQQFQKAARVINFPAKAKPSDLDLEQWVRLFEYSQLFTT